MWLLTFFLLPTVLITCSELTIDDYVINIDNNTLKNIKKTDRSSFELNLEGLALRRIDNGTFNDQINLKILNLANNSLVELPAFVFSNLTDLQHLSLAGNNITGFRNAFVGLSNLKTLNISNNPVVSLGPGEFYGLSTSVNISTLGDTLEKISAKIFYKPPESVRKHRRATSDIKFSPGDYHKSTFRVKACVENGKLKLVDLLKNNEILTTDCTEILSENNDRVYIENLNITSFEIGWFRIAKETIWIISLANNKITRMTPELLNNLPKNVVHVQLDGNKIERLERGIIENYNIARIWMTGNSMREIEDNAFEKTGLQDLNLNDNLLTDMKFVKSLPSSVEVITMRRNQLTEIPNDLFLMLPLVDWLHLDGNRITELYKDSLRGISYLYDFGLSDNQITKIAPGSFRHFRALRNIYLRNNSIAQLENGVFDGPNRVHFLDLGINKFTNVTEQIRGKLPKNLRKLSLDFNDIGSLEFGDFVDVPTSELYLRGNKITRVAKGSMMLPDLFSLDLGNNSLNHVDGELFENFRNIHEVRLDGNGISNIRKGFAKHLFYMTVLDISRNPIKKLENGALYGIQKDYVDTFILTSQTPIEIIHGGLFEDVEPLMTEFPIMGSRDGGST